MLDQRHHLDEGPQICGGDAADDAALERREMLQDTRGDGAAAGRRRDDEGAAIGFGNGAGDEPPLREPVEDAGQRRSLVGEPVVKLADGRGGCLGEQRENVRLALREVVLTQGGQIEADAVRRAVDRRHDLERHR
jgi:hypothetical protein